MAHIAQAVVVGYKPGNGRRAETVGSLLLGMYDAQHRLRFVGQVSTGFTEAALHELRRQLDERPQPGTPF